MPLRKDLAVTIIPTNQHKLNANDHLKVYFQSKNETKKFNKQTAQTAIQFVYHSEKDERLARMVFKFPCLKTNIMHDKIKL